jgi:thiosulfate reductase / polysulfide reductase chain A
MKHQPKRHEALQSNERHEALQSNERHEALQSNERRHVLQGGLAALSSLAVGQTIALTPTPAQAASSRKLVGQRKALRRANGRGRLKNDYSRATLVKSVCLNCSTVCGIQGHVIDGKLVKVGGNPLDPNNGKSLCAKGQASPDINTYADRLLFPLQRVGPRGGGQWKRISWEEAYAQIAPRIRKAIDEGKPEEVAIHIGRSRIGEEMGRFLNAIGSPSLFNHRALCSSNKRAANYVCLGETDWETPDAERTKYILNFGSNFYEAHQGAIHVAKRMIKGRFDNGAKLVTFDVRLSNTAGRSDEWWAPNPGSEGAVALAMAHAIMAAGQADRAWLDTWSNVGAAELEKWLAPYTPQWGEKLSGIPAADLKRMALEFAAARPACVAFTNRGSSAHYNGFNNDRAVILLNAVVGSIGKPGGYCYGEEPTRVPPRVFPQPQPRPPAAAAKSAIENPPEWPLANKWQRMKVGQIVFDHLKQGRGKLQVYISYTLAAPQTWPEGRSLAVEVLKDEKLIPFHVCSDIVYSETAHYADLILPDATYMERWGFDTRNNMAMRDYVTLRQPIVAPPGECRSFVDVMIELGKRISPKTAQYFQFKDHEDWIRQRCSGLTKVVGEDGFAYMKKNGVWQDTSKPPYLEVYGWPLSPAQLEGSRVDEATRTIWRRGADGREQPIGVMAEGKACRGFATPSRKFQVFSQDVADAAKAMGFPEPYGAGMPGWFAVPSIQNMAEDQLHLITFKWNVHTQGRTASQKLLSEIVHHNPLWMHTSTAAKQGLKTGDLVEITTLRGEAFAYKHATGKPGDEIGRAVVPVYVTEGIHPRVIAMSNSLGNFVHGRAGNAKRGPRQDFPGFDDAVIAEDQDLSEDLWWGEGQGLWSRLTGAGNGLGAGYNINAILPIYPAPLVGMQGWYDTVCRVRRA